MSPADARSRRLTLVACILGSAIVFVDGTVVNVALPALRSDLGAGLDGQQWVIEAYLLTLGSLVLIGGSLGDVLGRRRVFAAGVAGFGVTSLLCAIAPSIGVLIAARALQGIAGALLVPSSLAIITATFDDETERGAAIGSWTAWTSGAIAFGPPLGGLLVDAVSWRLVFAINVPLVLVTLILIARAVPAMPGRPAPIDYLGGVLCALGLAGPVYALIEQPRQGWGDAAVVTPLLGGLALLVAFVVYERRARAPMLPLHLFSSRNFTVGNVATLAIYGGLSASSFFLSLFLQQVGGYSALEAGVTLLPITVMLVLLSRYWGALSARIGPRALMGGGPLLAGAGLALFLHLDEHADYLGGVLPGAVVFGLGLSMTVAPLTSTVLSAVDQQHAGVASGVNNAVARVAGLLAIAAVGVGLAAVWSHTLDQQVPARLRDTPAVERAKERPLVLTVKRDAELRAAETHAAVRAFHAGIGVSALLVVLGGLISLVGIVNPRRPLASFRADAPPPNC